MELIHSFNWLYTEPEEILAWLFFLFKSSLFQVMAGTRIAKLKNPFLEQTTNF